MTRILAAIACLLAAAATAAAQTYPERTVRIIVPTGPGGGYDFVGRLVADQLAKRTGGNFVVESRTGAGTLVGTQAALAAPADGYTLLVGGLSNIVFNVPLYPNAGYDPLKDLVPVALVYTFPYVLVSRPDLPQSTLQQVIDAARAKPDALSVAGSPGSGQHMVAAAFMKATGVKLLEIPYRSAQATYPDLLSGRVDLFFDSAAAALPYIQSNRAKGIALVGPRRNALIPSVPTMEEAGLKGFGIESWIGLFVRAGTPPEAIAKLRVETRAALPELKDRFAASGGGTLDMEPAQTEAFIRSEFDAWTRLIRDAGIKLD